MRHSDRQKVTATFFQTQDTHPPAAAAWRHVLPRLSGVSIWKPAHRTESLLRVQIMLYLRPERRMEACRGKAQEKGSPQQNTQTARVADPGEEEEKKHRDREREQERVGEREEKY